MFLSEPPRVKAPEGPRTVAAAPVRHRKPRKPPVYLYKAGPAPDIRDIILNLTNGLSPELIDPDLYPEILPHMQAQEIRLRVQNPPAATRMRASIDYMINWRPPDEPVVREVPEEDLYLPSQHMIDDGVERAMTGADLSPLDPRLLQFLIPPLREERRRALEVGDYKTAKQADIGVRNVLSQSCLQEVIEQQDERIHDTAQKLEVAKIQLENVKEKWQLLLERKREEMDMAMAQMQEDFEREMEEFDAQFEGDPPPHRMKYSAVCLDLRAKEKSLVVSKRFKEAQEMRRELSQIEERERKQRKEEWLSDLLVERQKLIEKEKQKVFAREMAWQSAISKMELSAKQEIQHAQKTVNILQLKMDKSNAEAEFTKTQRKLPRLMLKGPQPSPKSRTVR